jgi:glycosyltransferase involved in cell wall biosynthesis
MPAKTRCLAHIAGEGISGWQPLVSIIIDNYNYGQFLPEAIDSALGQTYPKIEVIVVDDGSTDHSREVIASYGAQIIPALKTNGGQASAFNAGFALSRGEIIIFLDADDMLLPSIVEDVAHEFQTNPDIAKVQYRLAVVDAAGAPTGTLIPSERVRMLAGDIRRHVLAFPDDVPYPATSGHAFSADILRRILPAPEQAYGRVGADLYLYHLSSLCAPVALLETVGAYYRAHGANNHHVGELDLEQTRQIIVRSAVTHRYIKQFADSVGLGGFPADPAHVRSVTFFAHRMISLKLDSQRHPIAGDTVLGLWFGGIAAAFGRFDVPWPVKLLYAGWFTVMAPAPKPIARYLANLFFFRS